MSDSNSMKQLDDITFDIAKILVSDVLNKYEITPDKKTNLSEEQKQEIITLVENLKKQVDEFLHAHNTRLVELDASSEKQ
ncbi:hypothetical protein [Aneurinibacillus terranovensis]|uniref:hypothetical protein n=1 Tax=Aneurinibacillus terranovensis TaxID=278991 RepID=UPI000417A702|nr:hypothetical protein [Aneurinibacillus terranovensis]